MRRHTGMIVATGLLTGAWAVTPVAAQDRQLGWSSSTELTYLTTGGNTDVGTFGLKSDTRRVWEATTLKLELGGVRTIATQYTFTATGTPGNFVIDREEETEVTAENYLARARVQRDLASRTFLYVGGSWERNTFAGFRHRYAGVAGAGRRWFENAQGHLQTDLGLTFTSQDDVVDDPATSNSFVGLRLTAEYRRKVTENSEFGSDWAVDGNGKDTEDYRADIVNSLAVSLSSRLAFKTSFTVQYDNLPSRREVPFAAPNTGSVLVPLEKTDRHLSVALVIKF